MQIGDTFISTLRVDESQTALRLGSGDLPVFATPAMVALMENAAMLCVAPHLGDGQTTVGAEISTTHLRPSPVGAEVKATATLVAVEGRKLSFRVVAEDGTGVIGEATHVRFVVDRTKFMAKLQ